MDSMIHNSEYLQKLLEFGKMVAEWALQAEGETVHRAALLIAAKAIKVVYEEVESEDDG